MHEQVDRDRPVPRLELCDPRLARAHPLRELRLRQAEPCATRTHAVRERELDLDVEFLFGSEAEEVGRFADTPARGFETLALGGFHGRSHPSHQTTLSAFDALKLLPLGGGQNAGAPSR